MKGNQVDVVTCEIDIPRHQLSVEMGRASYVSRAPDMRGRTNIEQADILRSSIF